MTGKIIAPVAKKSSSKAAMVYASVSVCVCVCVCVCVRAGVCVFVCIFPSFTTPTWQGNSQSSDLKKGETGRGGGEREIDGFSRSRTREETASDGQRRGNKLPP